MKITRKQFLKIMAAGSAYLKFPSLTIAGAPNTHRKILFVYCPTGTTHKFFPDDLKNINNRWTNQLKTGLSDNHFNHITEPLKALKSKMILFHGLSNYGGAPTNHFESRNTPLSSGAGDGGGPSTVFTGGGGYLYNDTSKVKLVDRKIISLDRYFMKKGSLQGVGSFYTGVNCEKTEGGHHISFDGTKPFLIREPLGAIEAYNEHLCKSLNSCSAVLGPSKDELLTKIIEDNKNYAYKNENLFSQYIKALQAAKLAGSISGKISLTCNEEIKTTDHTKDSVKQTQQAIEATLSAFACGAHVGVLQFGTGHVAENIPLFECDKHHADSHFLQKDLPAMQRFENTHKKIIEAIAKIANFNIGSGKKFCDDVLIVVSSCLGELPGLHDGHNIPCLLIGGDPSILDHGKYYNNLHDTGSKPSGLQVDTNNYIKIQANYARRANHIKKKEGGYNQFLNSICYYMGYPPKKESMFVHGDAFGFLDKTQAKPKAIEGALDIFKKDKDTIPKNWG